jgi:hypothetical protein
MIEKTTCWKTPDGKLFEDFKQAQAHDKKVCRSFWKKFLHDLEVEQAKQKRFVRKNYWWGIGWETAKLQQQQKELSSRKKQIGAIRSFLGFTDA